MGWFSRRLTPTTQLDILAGSMLRLSSSKTRFAFIVAALILACNSQREAGDSGDQHRWREANHLPQPFILLGPKSLPNTNVDVAYARKYVPPMDADSIELTVIGDSAYYHPVAMIHRCFHFLGAYLKANDTAQLRRAEKYVAKLRSLSIQSDSAIFLPYPFDYRVHKNAKLQLKTPWVSGMAQGEFLAIVTRLLEYTGDSVYLDLAHQSFRSLTRLSDKNELWVGRVDSAGYFWLEEYPLEGLDQTLNGFVAAVYGVYDYLRVVGSDDARRMYDNCLTTLRRYLPEYRRPDSLSYYCLGHRHIADSSYHRLHISMCRELFRMSGDSIFLDRAREMNQDVMMVPDFQ